MHADRHLPPWSPPGGRVAVTLGGVPVGWMAADHARILRAAGLGPDLADQAVLDAAVGEAIRHGWCADRGEPFDVRSTHDGPVLGTLDRGALPVFGIGAVGAHLNGLVRHPDGLHLWVARRAASRRMDPGKLDHIAAGGVAAGSTPWRTLIREAAEEAAIPAELATQAREAEILDYATLRPEGLRRDRLHVYDLELPAGFVPRAADGEVEAFELWPMARVAAAVRGTDAFKFNVAVVLSGLFARLRRGPYR